MKLNFREIIQKVKDEFENFKESNSIDAIKYVDKKVLIGAGVILLIIFILYYYFIFFVYSPGGKKTGDKIQGNLSKETQQIINKQATTSFYSSMKPNMYSNVVSSPQTAADIYKMPANYMDITTIPVAQTDNYVKSFDIIYDYFKEINKGNYQNALLYLNKDFIAKNKISVDILSNYHKNTYFPVNTFIINSVVKTDNIYNVRFFVGNKDVTGVGFYITYKLTETNGKLDISINDLEKFIKQ